MKHKFLYIAIFVVLVFAISAGYVSLSMRQQASTNAVVATLQGMKTAFLEKIDLKSAPAEKAPAASGATCRYIDDGYGFSGAKRWSVFSGATEYDISKFLPKDMRDNELVSGVWAAHPANYNHVYFATWSGEPKTNLVNRIYIFDLDKHTLAKIYEENSPTSMILRVRGMDGLKLVIERDAVDNSPGPCAPVWSSGKGLRSYFSLDTDDIGSGLKPYVVSDCLYAVADAQSRACAEAMNLSEDAALGSAATENNSAR